MSQSSGQDDNDFNKEVEFISEEQKIEVCLKVNFELNLVNNIFVRNHF